MCRARSVFGWGYGGKKVLTSLIVAAQWSTIDAYRIPKMLWSLISHQRTQTLFNRSWTSCRSGFLDIILPYLNIFLKNPLFVTHFIPTIKKWFWVPVTFWVDIAMSVRLFVCISACLKERHTLCLPVSISVCPFVCPLVCLWYKYKT